MAYTCACLLCTSECCCKATQLEWPGLFWSVLGSGSTADVKDFPQVQKS